MLLRCVCAHAPYEAISGMISVTSCCPSSASSRTVRRMLRRRTRTAFPGSRLDQAIATLKAQMEDWRDGLGARERGRGRGTSILGLELFITLLLLSGLSRFVYPGIISRFPLFSIRFDIYINNSSLTLRAMSHGCNWYWVSTRLLHPPGHVYRPSTGPLRAATDA